MTDEIKNKFADYSYIIFLGITALVIVALLDFIPTEYDLQYISKLLVALIVLCIIPANFLKINKKEVAAKE